LKTRKKRCFLYLLLPTFITYMIHQPANKVSVSATVSLELINHSHAIQLLQLVNLNRQYLREWLPWVDAMQTVDDFNSYISRCETQHTEGSDYGYVIKLNEEVVGRIGVHHVNWQNRHGAIGYWLGAAFAGKGIITQSCQAILNYSFSVLKLNRVEIKCGTGNTKSAAIPERLCFKKEGVLRQAEWVNERFIDLYLYSMLKEEWNTAQTKRANE